MDDKVNLAQKLALLDKPYRPSIVGYLNDYKIVVVKARGEFTWHKHDETDDFFLVLRGRLTIQLRDRDVELEAGELFAVPRGVEHCPRADEEAELLLIEPRGTVNTGDSGRRADRGAGRALTGGTRVPVTIALLGDLDPRFVTHRVLEAAHAAVRGGSPRLAGWRGRAARRRSRAGRRRHGRSARGSCRTSRSTRAPA
jgi:mannose-6-phosphate isomerase-like protein (cupin superfamily)